MSRHSKIKEEFKTLEDLMFNNKLANANSKKKKYFKDKNKKIKFDIENYDDLH